MPTFHIKLSGSAIVVAENREDAEDQIRDGQIGCYCSLIQVSEEGKDVDQYGWPLECMCPCDGLVNIANINCPKHGRKSC